MKTITLKEIENVVKEVTKEYPYPKYIGDDLWQITPDCICNNKVLEELHKEIIKQLKGE